MVEVNIVYRGNLRCEAKHAPSNVQLVTDAPVDNMGKGESFSPTDLLATALGTCMLTIMGIAANKSGIDLGAATVRVTKEMAVNPVRRIGTLGVSIHVPIRLEPEQQQKLQAAALACPVHRSLHPDVKIPVEFHWG